MQNNKKGSYLVTQIIAWFFGVGSILLLGWAALIGPEPCDSGEFAGWVYGIFGLGGLASFLVNAPAMILLMKRRSSLTRLANKCIKTLLIINAILLVYVVLIGFSPSLRCP